MTHTILGANGAIGRELSRQLPPYGVRVRQFSRTPQRSTDDDEVMAGDLLNAAAVDRAIAGSDVAYLVAGLRYDAEVWREQWPRIMDHVIDACTRHGCRLVFFDNVYAYGRVNGAMTEDTPFNPVSRKGEVRARIATTLLDAMRRGDVRAMITRAPDFYGPAVETSMVQQTVFARLAAGKTPQWIGDPQAVHSFTFTPDAGRAVAVLAQEDQAYGHTWHVPTDPARVTGEDFVRMASEAAGRRYRIQVAPRWMLRLMGIAMPVLRENMEMMYQYEHDYWFDSSRIRAAYGLAATPYAEGIGECVRAAH